MSLADAWVQWAPVVVAATVAVALAVLRLFAPAKRQRRAMRRLPVTKLNAAKPGATVKVQGRVTTRGSMLESPLERRECCAYRLLVWDASEDAPKLVLDTSNARELDVETDGVAASIRSSTILLEGRGEPQYKDKGERPTGAQALIIERYGLEPTRMTFQEFVLCARDEVTVIAKVSSEEDGALDDARFRYVGSGGYRSKPRRRILVSGEFPLTIVAPGGQL